MTVASLLMGATTDTTVKVTAVTTAASARLVVSTSPTFTSPVFFGPVAPTAQDVATFTATGLTAATDYYCRVEEDGVVDTTNTGEFRTFPTPGAQVDLFIAASGCAKGTNFPWVTDTSNSPIFDTIRGHAPDFFCHLGDLHYRDIATNDVDAYRQAYTDAFSAPRQAQLYRSTPLVYVWDDHDYATNDSDGTAPGRPAAAQVYRERIPSYDLPAGAGDAPIYHSFTRGRILFLVSDTRWAKTPRTEPDGPSKTMLGSAQKSWMAGVLASSAAEFLVWLNPTPWMGLSQDTWNGYATERQEIADLLELHGWTDRMVCITSDYHGVGMDTGTGNTWGGFPVYVWGAMDSGTEGGSPTHQYDMGPTSIGSNRYGTLHIEDRGDFLTVNATAYLGSSVLLQHRFSVVLAAGGEVPPRDLTLTYDDTISRVRVVSAEVAGVGPVTPLTDTFNRTTANGWGTASSGHEWATSGGTASDYATTGSVGRIGHTSTVERRFVTTGEWEDVEFVGSINVPVTPEGANIIGGWVFRYTDDNNAYHCWLSHGLTGGLALALAKRVAGGFTTLATQTLSASHTPGVKTWFRVRAAGTVLSAKAWKDTDMEPVAWTLTASDPDFTTGKIGAHSVLLTGNTNTQPVNIDYDDIATAPPPPVTIDLERSPNGITWSPVRGGQDREVPAGASLTVDDYEFVPNAPNTYRATVYNSAGEQVGVQTATLTPPLGAVWIKNISRPFLNRAAAVVDFSDVSRPSRAGVFDVVGRTLPVAVTDLPSSRRLELSIVTDTEDQAAEWDSILAAGDTVLIQAPADCPVPVPTLYAVIGDVTATRPGRLSPVRVWTLPLTEVAAPDASVVGAAVTWQAVLNSYATWADVAADSDNWAALLDLIGSPDDVVVG